MLKPTQETGKYLPKRETAEFKVHRGGVGLTVHPPPKKKSKKKNQTTHKHTYFLRKGTIITLLCLYHDIKLVSHTVEKKRFKAA